MAVIGSGLEAETNLRAVCSVRPITRASVYSRSPERRSAFAERMSSMLGIRVTAVSTPQEAVAGKDIVVVATNTGPEPVVALQGAWLEAGQHVVSIGSTTAALREIDIDTFLRADTVVFDASLDQLSHESGDVMALIDHAPDWIQRGQPGPADHRQRARPAPSRRHHRFQVGRHAAQDLIGASHVVREARQLGIGTEVDEIAYPKQF